MACFHPLEAWYDEVERQVYWDDRSERHGASPILLPCGRCIGCRLVRARSWAVRCMHESQMHRDNCFVTLTYDDRHYGPSLNYSDFQRFMKRLRKSCRSYFDVTLWQFLPRFFAVGEYGSISFRPHFHALLFGVTFPREYPVAGQAYGCKELSRLWPYGYSSFGDVTFQSAAYCARYACKKVTGDLADAHYTRVDVTTGEYVRVVPEFAHMSLKPGIGYTWFQKYWKECALARDGVIVRGKVVPSPRYYDTLLDNLNGDLKEINDLNRYAHSQQFRDDCTPERLLVREQCAKAKLAFLKRSL